MKRKTPMMKRWFALLLAGLLMVAPAVLAEEEDGAGFGTFFQPEGVELCEVEEAVPCPCRTVLAACMP